MMRLVRRGLMYGNLFEVRSPALVERYNRALEHLIGKRTELTDFHIDISGFSPEIGDELGDDLYLNPGGVNRQFILLSTDQKTAPLLNAQFSTSRSILRKWIDANEAQLFSLTARDAVAGELVNSVFSVDTPADLMTIRDITVEADTLDAHVETGRELGQKIDRFLTEDDAWWDDVLIADMIELAKTTGDITRNPILLQDNTFAQGNFFTEHFGGVYVFRDVEESAVISAESLDIDKRRLGVKHKLDFSDRNAIAAWLEEMDLAEPVVAAKHTDVSAILQQKMDFIVVDTAARAGAAFKTLDRRELRHLARRHLEDLPQEYAALYKLWRYVEGQGGWPRITSKHPAYFYTLRSADHADRDLVNMMLAHLSPLDIRQLFICHKSVFYAAYNSWPDAKKEYVANYLANEYMLDKAGAREALFGHEPEMAEEPKRQLPEPLPEGVEDRIKLVGPWGAVTRR